MCVGEFLFAINRELAHIINTNDKYTDEMKGAQFAVLNSVFFEIAYNWCKCPLCVKRADALVALINKYKDDVQGTLKGSEDNHLKTVDEQAEA